MQDDSVSKRTKSLASDSPFVSADGETWRETWTARRLKDRLRAWTAEVRRLSEISSTAKMTLGCLEDILGYAPDLLVQYGDRDQICLVVEVLDQELSDWADFGGPVWPVETLREYLSHGLITVRMENLVRQDSNRRIRKPGKIRA